MAAAASARPAFAQPAEPPPAQPTAPPPVVPDRNVVLETAFDHAQRLTVPVFLNGKGPFDFVVDTGSNRCVVCAEVADYCRLPEVGVAPVHGILSAEPATLVRVDRTRVGQVASAGLRMPKVLRSRVGADGILGLDMLHGRRIVLGFQAQTFSIEVSNEGPYLETGRNSRIASPDRPISVPARFQAGQLVIIDAEAAGQGVTAFLDSGSQVTVANQAMRRAVLAARPDLAQGLIHSQLISATGQRAAADFGQLPGLRLGGVRIDSPLVGFADLHIFDLWDLQNRPTLLIGVDTLRRFEKVAFDFSRKVITFWPLRIPYERRRGG
jgi:hypothetical protein